MSLSRFRLLTWCWCWKWFLFLFFCCFRTTTGRAIILSQSICGIWQSLTERYVLLSFENIIFLLEWRPDFFLSCRIPFFVCLFCPFHCSLFMSVRTEAAWFFPSCFCFSVLLCFVAGAAVGRQSCRRYAAFWEGRFGSGRASGKRELSLSRICDSPVFLMYFALSSQFYMISWFSPCFRSLSLALPFIFLRLYMFFCLFFPFLLWALFGLRLLT